MLAAHSKAYTSAIANQSLPRAERALTASNTNAGSGLEVNFSSILPHP